MPPLKHSAAYWSGGISAWCTASRIFIARQHTDARYWYSNSVYPSVRLSVRPWHAGIVWKRPGAREVRVRGVNWPPKMWDWGQKLIPRLRRTGWFLTLTPCWKLVPARLKTALHIVIGFSPYGSPIILILPTSNIFTKFRRGHPLRGR